MLFPSCTLLGVVLSSCGVGTPVLLHYAVLLLSRCSFLAHLYLWSEWLLSSIGMDPPLEMWCERLLLSSSGVWGLLSTCSVWLGSSLVAVMGSSQVVVGDSNRVALGDLLFLLS